MNQQEQIEYLSKARSESNGTSLITYYLSGDTDM